MATASGITLEGVSRTFTSRGQVTEALRGVSLTTAPGSFTALIGPSGCGKSTILRLCLGLDRPDAGTVTVDGLKPEEATRKGLTGVAMRGPDRPAVKFRQRLPSLLHVRKAAQPDEHVRPVEVAKLTDHRHAGVFLWFDEVAVEQADERVAGAGMQGILAQFDDGRCRFSPRSG